MIRVNELPQMRVQVRVFTGAGAGRQLDTRGSPGVVFTNAIDQQFEYSGCAFED